MIRGVSYRVTYAIKEDEITVFVFDSFDGRMDTVAEEALERICADHDGDESVLDQLLGFSILRLPEESK